jgi:AraC family transcriptional regulator
MEGGPPVDWLDRMNAAIDYIEGNLTGDIDYKQGAIAACCPNYHFQRMFALISEVTLSEYIRRRRLTLAAFELQQSNKSVIEIAHAYGYQSHASFTRAFRELHGASPTSTRKSRVKLKAFPRTVAKFIAKASKANSLRHVMAEASHKTYILGFSPYWLALGSLS